MKTSEKIIRKIIRNKPFIELAVGVRCGDNIDINVFTNKNHQPTKDARYEIGSLTKIFTTTLIAKHVYNGELSLDTPISDYLPVHQLQYYPSINKLATHTSGYPSFLPLGGIKDQLKIALGAVTGGKESSNNPFSTPHSRVQLYEIIEHFPLKDKEYSYRYGNVNFSILGEIIATNQNKSYVSCMESYIQDELGLTHTHFGRENLIAGFYGKKSDRGNWLWDKNETTIAAGGLYGTPFDLLSFAHQHNNISHTYFEMMQKKRTKGSQGFDMALGWKVLDGDNILWHDGGTGRFVSFLGMNRKTKKEVVILSNYRTFYSNKLGFTLLNE